MSEMRDLMLRSLDRIVNDTLDINARVGRRRQRAVARDSYGRRLKSKA